ncbi:hypothetical protein F183_A08400 [Bryobacterales bacterium F-183]|nr:hypothetical protein F183_A08400 [Bryobacterales bacterium F-183]
MDDPSSGRSRKIAEDAATVVRNYLGLSPNKNLTATQLIDELEKKIKAIRPKEHAAVREGCLAILACKHVLGDLKRLNELLLLLREREILESCPKLCITFQDLAWDDYYTGGNIKYPDVRALQAKCCKPNDIVQKMQLFFLLQNDRRQKCTFVPASISDFNDDDEEKKKCPALLIPSSGKHGKWLGEALAKPKEFWWVRCLEFCRVIFLVSADEAADYEQFAKWKIDVVTYTGFGMGCGRAAGIALAKKLNRVCMMTDDRTVDLFWNETSVTKDDMANLAKAFRKAPFINGVLPKGELNILTIINPAAPQHVTFSPFFIASKEDKALHLFCKMFEAYLNDQKAPCPISRTSGNLRVGFDGANPNYENTAAKYEGSKGEALAKVTKCDLYKSTDEVPLVWDYLKGKKGFLNLWDAIKMQDSAMYLLLKEIHDHLTSGKASAEDWDAFDAYIRPWFT